MDPDRLSRSKSDDDAAMETPSYESPGMPTPATRNIVGTSELAFSSPAVGGTV